MKTDVCFENCPDVLDARMIAGILRIGYTKALNLIQYGGMDFLKIGNTYRVTKKSFTKWLETDGKRNITING